jgi:hypothetical protein
LVSGVAEIWAKTAGHKVRLRMESRREFIRKNRGSHPVTSHSMRAHKKFSHLKIFE